MNEPFFEPELAQRVNMLSIPTMAPDRTPDSSRSTTRPIARPFSTCIFPRPYSDPASHIMSSPEEVVFSDPRVDQHAPSISTATAGRYKTHRRRLSSASRSAVSVVRSCTSMSEEESKRRTASLFVGTPKFSSPITIPQGRVVGGGNEKVAVPDSVSRIDFISGYFSLDTDHDNCPRRLKQLFDPPPRRTRSSFSRCTTMAVELDLDHLSSYLLRAGAQHFVLRLLV